MKSSTERFSDRVENYVKYRPSYPPALVMALKEKKGTSSLVADIGSGTGILTRQLLAAGFKVIGVEPNAAMRAAAEQSLGSKFRSVTGTAEETTLADRSIDLITVAQAFHWFDRDRARIEFKRILKPGGILAVIWNHRVGHASEVNRRYDEILTTLVPGYLEVTHRNIRPEDMEKFFQPNLMTLTIFKNGQNLDRARLIGRFESSSYAPKPGEPGYKEVRSAVEKLFDDHQSQGLIEVIYETQMFWGELS